MRSIFLVKGTIATGKGNDATKIFEYFAFFYESELIDFFFSFLSYLLHVIKFLQHTRTLKAAFIIIVFL